MRDREAFERFNKQFVPLAHRLLLEEVQRRKPCCPGDMAQTLEAFAGSLATALVGMLIWVTPKGSDQSYDRREVGLDCCLQWLDFHARSFLAHMHGEKFEPSSQPQIDRDTLMSLRKSIGRLYGVVKDLEKAS